jgi:MSHA biogenesis protein MshK
VSDRKNGWIAWSIALTLFGPVFCPVVSGQELLADPTRPTAAFRSGSGTGGTAAGPAKWTLTSTLIAPDRRVAVINGKVVQVGQKIDGAELVAVETGSVLLRRAGRKIELKLMAGSVKEAVKPAPGSEESWEQ